MPNLLQDDEEEDLDLPPLDGALDDDEGSGVAGVEDEIGDEPEGAGDDAAAIDLDPGVTLDVGEEPSDGEADLVGEAVDIGSIADALAVTDEGDRASDESGLADEPEDQSPFDTASEDEAGAGTGEDPAAFVDEDHLPPLDGEPEDGAAGALGQACGIEPALGRERARWRVASGRGAQVPCWLVAVSPACVVAAGPTVLVAREGTRAPSAAGAGIDAVALAASDEAIFAVARRGALLASVDGGDSWATGSVPWPASRGALAIAATPGRLWICDGGALWSVRWSRRSRPEPPILVRAEGVRAMVAAGSTLVILAQRGDDLAVERLRGDDEATPAQAVPPPVRAAIGDAPPILAASASGRSIAILAGGAVHVTRDGGRTFRRIKVAAIAAAFAGDDDEDDARLVVLASGAEGERDRGRGALFLAEVDEDGGAVERVADVPGGAEASGRAAMAWDGAREVLWVACAAGLVGFERSAQH
jgi:hypothetical protein